MTTNGESKFSRLVIGLGLGAIGGLMAAILARKETLDGLRERSSKSLEYLNQLAGKLGETASVVVQQGKKFLGCKGANSVEHSTTAEKQAYQEDRRENLGG
jgi:gas vesicle protein